MEWPHLSQAPVNEAIIDIRVQLPDSVDIPKLKNLHAQIAKDYPDIKERRKWEGKLEVKAGGPLSAASIDLGIIGYLFTSSDKLQVVQFRINGFTFSRLKPYQNWNALRDEAKRLWNIYKSGTNLETISRIAVRYINVLDMPLPIDLKRYLTSPPTPPTISSDKPLSLNSFLNRLIVKESTLDVISIITLALEEAKSSSKQRVLLDIDVFKSLILNKDDEAWRLIELFRNIKNQFFFGSITEDTINMYK